MAARIKVGDAAVVIELSNGKMTAYFEGVIPSGVGSTRNDAIDDLSDRMVSLAKQIKFAKNEIARIEKAGTDVAIHRDSIPTKPGMASVSLSYEGHRGTALEINQYSVESYPKKH